MRFRFRCHVLYQILHENVYLTDTKSLSILQTLNDRFRPSFLYGMSTIESTISRPIIHKVAARATVASVLRFVLSPIGVSAYWSAPHKANNGFLPLQQSPGQGLVYT